MAQFDVFQNPIAADRGHYPHLVDIQHRHCEELSSRLVAPLGPAALFKNAAIDKLTPAVSFQGEDLLFLTYQIFAIHKRRLKTRVGSLEQLRGEIINALDFAITGV